MHVHPDMNANKLDASYPPPLFFGGCMRERVKKSGSEIMGLREGEMGLTKWVSSVRRCEIVSRKWHTVKCLYIDRYTDKNVLPKVSY